MKKTIQYSKTEKDFIDHKGNFGKGYFGYEYEGQRLCLSRYSLDKDEYVLEEKYYFGRDHQVESSTIFSNGKKIKTQYYDNAEISDVLYKSTEPISTQYHMVDDIRTAINTYSEKAKQTKEELLGRISTGIDNAVYIKNSVGTITNDYIGKKKDQGAEVLKQAKSKIDAQKEKIFNEVIEMRNAVKNKLDDIKSKISGQYNDFKGKVSKRYDQTKDSVASSIDKTKETFTLTQSKNKPPVPAPIIIIINNTQGSVTGELINTHGVSQNPTPPFNSEEIVTYANRIQSGDIEARQQLLQSLGLNSNAQAMKI